MYPHFDPGQVKAFQVSRVREMLALTTVNYSVNALPPLRTSADRISVVNSAQIANGTLNVNETVALADRQAGDLLRHLASSPASRPTAGAA
jgi:hypothetical protein